MSRDLFTNQLLSLSHVIKDKTKSKYWWKSSIMWRKIKTSVYAITTNGFHLWLGINWEVFYWKYDCEARHVYEHILIQVIDLVGSLWYGILLKDQAQAIKEKVQMEFIVNVQNLTQCGKGKWWRNQPRWLVRGTKQPLVKQRLTMCELLGWSC